MNWIKEYLRPAADFPEPGVTFLWYGPLLKDPAAFRRVIEAFAVRYRDTKIDAIAGCDARGFLFGGALAYELSVPFVIARKPGKLPGPTEVVGYELEYGSDALEMELESIKEGERVLIIDDVIATGGTIAAAVELVGRLGGEVIEVACMLEIKGLGGREAVKAPLFTLLSLEA